MIKIIKLVSVFFISVTLINSALAESSFFEEGKIKYNEKKYEESKFLFQRSIVFNPKDHDSYLYLSKIYVNLGFLNPNNFLIFAGLFALFLMLLSLSVKAIHAYVHFRYALYWEASISTRLISKYLRQPYPWFLKKNSADLAKSVLSEVNQVVFGCILSIIYIVSNSLAVLGIIIFLLFIDPYIILLVTSIMSLIFFIIFQFTKKYLSAIGKERIVANEERFISVSEAFGAIKVIKIGALEKIYLARFRNAAKIFADNNAVSQIIGQLPRYLLEACGFGGIIIMLIVLISTKKEISSVLPIIALYVLSAYRLLPAIQSVYSSVTQLRFVQPALDELYFDMIEPITENRILKLLPKMLVKEKIFFSNVYFNYDANVPILSNINIDIKVNSSVGIIGATGSGKTTLIDILLGLLTPTEGTIYVDNKILNYENIHKWQKNIGYVPQNIYLSDGTIAENIAFGVPFSEIDQKALFKAAKIANIHNFITNDLTNGYSTIVGERGIRLSGGERQRIGIARALYSSPKVLILDEATSALDSVTEARVMCAMNELVEKITTITIAHRLSTVRNCDIIYLLEKGVVQGQGTYNELKSSNDIFQKMLGLKI